MYFYTQFFFVLSMQQQTNFTNILCREDHVRLQT